jgi:hypothetical protein
MVSVADNVIEIAALILMALLLIGVIATYVDLRL